MARGPKSRIVATDGALTRVPPAPADMSERAVTEWKKVLGVLVPQRKIAAHELSIVDAYCRVVSRISECEIAIAKYGLTFESDSGPKRRPETTILKECHATLARLAGELGLTPASRAKNKGGAVPDDDDDDLGGL